MDCIFCKIIAGEIPSYKVYEDERFFAILDRFPAALGHVIVLSKNHADNLYELDDTDAASLMPLVKRLAKAVKDATNCAGVNIVQNNGVAAGQTVNHFHMHIIPRFDNDNISVSWNQLDPKPEVFTETLTSIKLAMNG